MKKRIRIIVALAAAAIVGAGTWVWATRGKESTDDAQVEAHVTPIAARVGGTVAATPVVDNQTVDAGAVLVQLDRRDFELAISRLPLAGSRTRRSAYACIASSRESVTPGSTH